MNLGNTQNTRFLYKCLALVATAVLAVPLFGQGNSGNATNRVPLSGDWTDGHVVFSNPTDPQKQVQINRDPRFWKQWYGRNLAGTRNATVTNPAAGTNGNGKKSPPPPPPPTAPQGDWSVSLGPSSASHVAPIMYPAKFSFNINADPSCTQDFVVFAENATAAQATPATQTGTFTSSAQNTNGTITINGIVFTGSKGTAATGTGTFTAQPAAGAITVATGSGTLTMTNSGTPKTVTGTFSGGPVLTADSITVTTGGNGLVLKAGGTAPTVTGTFTAQTTSGAIVINYNGSNTLTLTPTTGNTGTVTFSAVATSGDIVTIDGTQYTFVTSLNGGGAKVLTGSTANHSAQNLRAAIDGVLSECATSSCFQNGGNSGATATVSGAVTTVKNTTTGSITFTKTSSVITLNPSGGTILGPNSCSSSTAGTFLTNSNTTTEAGNLATAINSCHTSFAAVGVTAGSATNTTTVTAVAPGSAVTLNTSATTANNFSWGSVSAGTDVSAGCPSVSTAGFFVNANTASTLASNLASAINSCHGSFSAVQVTATNPSANQAQVTQVTPGSTPTLTVGPASSVFSWGSVTGGSDGSNTCPSLATAKFATSSNLTTLATNIVTLITTTCSSIGVTASNSSGAVTITATNNGTVGNFSLSNTLSAGVTGFSGSFTGTNGTTDSTHFATTDTAINIAANLATAIGQNSTTNAALNVSNGSSGSNGTVTIASKTAGAGGTFSTSASETGFSWGTLTPGVDGQPGIVALNNLYSGAATFASSTGAFSGTFSSSDLTGGETTTISNPNLLTSLVLTASPPVKASQTGTFSGSNTTGTVSVNGTTFTATVGTKASNTGSVSSNGVSAGQTFAVNGFTMTASAPTNQTSTLTFGNQPASNSFVTIGSITYTFKSTTGFSTPGSNNCNVLADTVAHAEQYLWDAISNSATTTQSSSRWLCASGATPNGLASVTSTEGANPVALLAVTAGSTGFTVTPSTGGDPHANITVSTTNGTDGSTSGANFPYWFGNAAASTTQLASNIATVISNNSASTLATASSGGTTTVTVTASTAGSAGNSITLSSGLTGFSWTGGNGATLLNGSDGTNTGQNFATSTDTTTEAANLRDAINRTTATSSVVTASSSGAVVTITANTAGAGGNSISLGDSLSTFAWTSGATALSGGSDGSASGANFPYWTNNAPATAATLANNLAAAINRAGNGSSVHVVACTSTVTASNCVQPSTTGVVNVTATDSGILSNSITLTNNDVPNFTWANSTLIGGTAAGTCTTGPSVTWSYDTHTGSGGTVTTSPVLSKNGQMIAFVESRSGANGGSVLHILRPNTAAINGTGTEGTVILPVVPTTVINSTDGNAGTNWSTCLAGTGSCMFNLAYNSTTNTFSSPFPNYDTDDLYVGDDGGTLWKFSGVFNGTPTLVGGTSIGVTQKLTGPVFDSTTTKVFVGDDAGGMSYFTDSGVGAPALGGRVTGSFSNITDPPIVDSTTGKVHFFGVNTGTSDARVVQADTTLTVQATASVGTSTGQQIHAGTFNNTYYGSVDGTGRLYVCGHDSSGNNTPVLYSVAMTSGAMASITTGSLALGTSAVQCSPLSEIYNSGQSTDWLFVGIPSSCAFGGASTGCVESFKITAGFPSTAAATGSTPGGPSGMVVDNVSSSGHASSLYYSTLGSATCVNAGDNSLGGCAVQRTQAGLQ